MELRNRLFQALSMGAAVAFGWFAMQAVHESGHVPHAWITGAGLPGWSAIIPRAHFPIVVWATPIDSLMAACHPPIIYRRQDPCDRIAIAAIDIHKHRA
jgi:hypothetical protein